MSIMLLFFDIGQKGAISFFKKNKLLKVSNFELSNKCKKSIKHKLFEFQKMLQNNFKKHEVITDIGCYKPFGSNPKTIINLAMMVTILIIFFEKANFHFVNEWNSWKTITQAKRIPLRKEKKKITIQWVQKKFKLKNLNDDEADAILGGFFVSTNTLTK